MVVVVEKKKEKDKWGRVWHGGGMGRMYVGSEGVNR